MALDKFFLTVFIMEILIKWYHDFFGFWKVNWNIFDFIIVAASLLGPSKETNGDIVLEKNYPICWFCTKFDILYTEIIII